MVSPLNSWLCRTLLSRARQAFRASRHSSSNQGFDFLGMVVALGMQSFAALVMCSTKECKGSASSGVYFIVFHCILCMKPPHLSTEKLKGYCDDLINADANSHRLSLKAPLLTRYCTFVDELSIIPIYAMHYRTRYVDGTPTSEVTPVTIWYIHPPYHGYP